MKKLLCFALVLVLLLAVTVSVSAESTETDWENMDWNSVDWETVDWNQLYNGSEAMKSLRKWLEEEASFPAFFEYGGYTKDWRLIDFDECANRRFIADPDAFLIALTEAEETMQEHLIQGGLFPNSVVNHSSATVAAIKGIQLLETEHPEAVALLRKLIETAEEKLNTSFDKESIGVDWANMDWDSVDWETFDWKMFDLSDESASLSPWLKTEASLAKLFEVARNCSHAAYGETLGGIYYERFMEKPEEFLIALGKEDAETQDRALLWVAVEFAYTWEFYDKETTVNTLEGITLSRAENPEAVALLEGLIGRIEEKLDISIDNPKTGDPILLAVATLLLSGSGLAVLCRKKKE